jgi:hypothetical protein
MTGGRWGKPGVRLTPAQVAARQARARVSTQQRDRRREADTEVAHRLWAEGMVAPCMITAALDMHQMYGPEVDAACNAAEPEVDLWEAGKLYPRWDQLCALAELTGRPPRYFTSLEHLPLDVMATSMRFHLRRGERVDDRPALARFPDPVVARCPGTVLHRHSSE